MNNPQPEYLAFGLTLFFIFVIGIIGFIVLIFFTNSIYKCLKKVKEENQSMTPGLVWLNLIPFLGSIWIFFIIVKVRESLSKEFSQQPEAELNTDYGFKVGIAFAILQWCGFIPGIGQILIIISIVCWIIYWVKITKYSKMLDKQADLLTTYENN